MYRYQTKCFTSDVSQVKRFIPTLDVSAHRDTRFGTHHARDAWHLFQTCGLDLNLFSSAIQLKSQYRHSLWLHRYTPGAERAAAMPGAPSGSPQ